MRRRIIIASTVAAIPALLLLAAVLFMPAERVGSMVATRMEAALQRDVNVERIRIRILPRPAIVLEQVAVGGITPKSKLAVARRIELRPRLLPLLRRRAVIDEIVLDRPQVLVAVARDGTSNLPVFKKTKTKKSDAELSIRHVRINNGTFVYRDARNGTALRLAGLQQSLDLSGPLTGKKPVNASGELSIKDIDANLPGQVAWPLRNLTLRIDHSLAMHRAEDRVEVEQLKVAVQEMELQLAGAMHGLRDARARKVDLRLSTENVDIEKLLASLPQALLTANGDALSGAAGHVKLAARLAGRVGAGATPDLRGVLQLTDVALARGKHGKIVSDLNGAVAFSLDSIATSGITGELLGRRLRFAFDVNDFAAPHGRVSVQTSLALAEAQKLGFFPKGTSARGDITMNVTAHGSLTQPKEALLTGHVSLAGVEMQTAALKKPVVVQQGRIKLHGRDASAQEVRARIGRSDVALDFSAKEWLPYALGDSTRTPTVTFDARSSVFDVDEIFGAKTEKYRYSEVFFARLSNKTLNGKTAAQAAEEVGLGMPDVPPIAMDGRIRAAQLVRAGVRFDNVDVTIAARSGEVDVRGASFRMMGGGVKLTGRLGLSTAGADKSVKQPLLLDYEVSDLKAEQFIKRFTTFRDQISGKMLLAGSVQMYLDRQLLPDRESLSGKGTVAILDGEIVNWPLLRVLGERIGAARFDTLAFQDWKGRYRFAGPKLLIDESDLNARDMRVRAAGTVDLDGTLDLGATLYLPQQVAARIPGAPAALMVKTVSDADGRVPVGSRITGTARQPKMALDLSEAGTRAAHAAREAAQQEAKKVATKAADKIVGRVIPRDSAATTDSVKSKVTGAISDRFKKMIKPKGGV